MQSHSPLHAQAAKAAMDFKPLIRAESAKLEELHGRIHTTVAVRDRDIHARQEWERACEEFHSYASPLDVYIQRACAVDAYTDPNLLEFVVSFLEEDPWFFRSGYLKQAFIARIKQSTLREPIRRRLRNVLLDAVNRRGTSEFKYYCRLAAMISDDKLIARLRTAIQPADPSRSERAQQMLSAIEAGKESK